MLSLLDHINLRKHTYLSTVIAMLSATHTMTANADLITVFDGTTTGGWSLDNAGILTATTDAAGTGLPGIEANDQNDGGTYYVSPWTGDLSIENGQYLRFGLIPGNPGGSWVPSTQDIIIQGNGMQLTADLAFDTIAPPPGVLISLDVLLTGATFGTDDTTFASVMSNITAFKIRAEYWNANGIESYLVAPAVVPLPAAVWLFGSGLLAIAGIAGRRNAKKGT
ncbi:MAG: laminin B domain-containing protein [Gammaproteobacteria bacterium]